MPQLDGAGIVRTAAGHIQGRPVFLIKGIGIFADGDSVWRSGLVAVFRGRSGQEGTGLIFLDSEPFPVELLFIVADLCRALEEIQHFKGSSLILFIAAQGQNCQRRCFEGRIQRCL